MTLQATSSGASSDGEESPGRQTSARPHAPLGAAALAGVTMRAGDEFCGVCADDDVLVALAAHGGCAADAPAVAAVRPPSESVVARSCTASPISPMWGMFSSCALSWNPSR